MNIQVASAAKKVLDKGLSVGEWLEVEVVAVAVAVDLAAFALVVAIEIDELLAAVVAVAADVGAAAADA